MLKPLIVYPRREYHPSGKVLEGDLIAVVVARDVDWDGTGVRRLPSTEVGNEPNDTKDVEILKSV